MYIWTVLLSGVFLTLFTAIIVGRLEQFEMNHGFHTGPPNFLKYFVFPYHILMLLLCLTVLYAFKTFWMLPLWILFEDIFYFVGNEQDKLDSKDWITGGFGGFWLGAQFIPWVYVGLAVVSLISYLLFA